MSRAQERLPARDDGREGSGAVQPRAEGVPVTDARRRLYHDIRTHLHHLIGFTELLIDEQPPDDHSSSRRTLERLHELSNRLLASLVPVFDEVGGAGGRRALAGRQFGQLLHEIIELGLGLEREALMLAGRNVTSDLHKVVAASEKLRALLEELRAVRAAERSRESSAGNAPTAVSVETLPAGKSGAHEGQNGKSRDGAVILVVDDNPLNRDMLSRRLLSQGYQVVTAENGRLAMETLEMAKIDLVLLDIMMPVMDGYAVLKEMKARDPLRDVPVVMISAVDDMSGIAACIEMGAEDYLLKPFDPALLRARVNAGVEKKWLRDQELRYLAHVAQLTEAAAAVEMDQFAAENLDDVASRDDQLGQLARVFQRMAREVQAREQRLKEEVQELRVKIDEVQKAREVAQIVDTPYFQQLELKLRALKARRALGSD